LGAVAAAGFGQQVGHMGFHGAHVNGQRLGNGPVAEAFPEMGQNIPLALGQVNGIGGTAARQARHG